MNIYFSTMRKWKNLSNENFHSTTHFFTPFHSPFKDMIFFDILWCIAMGVSTSTWMCCWPLTYRLSWNTAVFFPLRRSPSVTSCETILEWTGKWGTTHLELHLDILFLRRSSKTVSRPRRIPVGSNL